ncbi:hypothetical protein VTO42DRAFT_4313 [Malbranchea cinnamomea]
MPPRKDKTEKAGKVSAEDGTAMILEYLRQQNRPYSAIDISANLHNKVSKAYTAKALKALHEKKLIEERVSGKQLVYHAIQDAADEASPDELAEMDKEIESLRDQIARARAQDKELKAELAALSARVPTAELREQVRGLEAARRGLLAELEPLRNASGSKRRRMVSEEEQARVEREWRRWQRTAGARKRICRELWDRCTEVLPEGVGSREEFWEELGLEGQL